MLLAAAAAAAAGTAGPAPHGPCVVWSRGGGAVEPRCARGRGPRSPQLLRRSTGTREAHAGHIWEDLTYYKVIREREVLQLSDISLNIICNSFRCCGFV